MRLILAVLLLAGCTSNPGFTIDVPETISVGEPLIASWSYAADTDSVVMIRYQRASEYGAPIETYEVAGGERYDDYLLAYAISDDVPSRYAFGLESFLHEGDYTITFAAIACEHLNNPCGTIGVPSELTGLMAREDERVTIEKATITVTPSLV